MRRFACAGTAALTAAAAVGLTAIALAAEPGSLKSVAKGDMAGLAVSTNRAPEPATQIWDAKGHLVTLAHLKAPEKLMVVDLWATWCGGCVQEMPTLAKLQSAYRGRILVVPISMDLPKDREKARAFMAQIPQLPFYQNTTDHWPPAITTALVPRIVSFPDALIYDRNGREIARLTGKTADWNGPDAHALFDRLLDASHT
jgi:thiol-disulfide isomerase/thioredoxin